MVGKLTTILLIITSIFLLGLKTNIFTSQISNMENIYQRVSLIRTSGAMVKENPISGVGLGNFIINIPKYSIDNTWILQPVHNIYLLIFAETGLIGLVIFFIISIKIVNKVSFSNKRNFIYLLLFILITGFFDHYWISIQQNLLLEVLVFAMILREDIKFT
jgi:O-antigen ligase